MRIDAFNRAAGKQAAEGGKEAKAAVTSLPRAHQNPLQPSLSRSPDSTSQRI